MIQKYSVSRDDRIYHAWPDLVMTSSGKLICVFTECVHHRDRHDSRVVYCQSLDRGRTWSEKKALTPKTQPDDHYNNPRIRRLNDDTLVIICDKIQNYENNERSADVSLWFADSEGNSWSEPIKTPAMGIVPEFQELRSGRWILAAHFKGSETGKLEQYMWYSDDRGKTWSDRIVIAADVRYNLCEVSILELSDDTLIAFMRENTETGCDCLKSISHDGGETWHGVYNVPIPACHRPVAKFLQDGSIMLTHRYIQGGPSFGQRTQNLFAAFMSEESALETVRNRQSVRIMPIDYDRSPNPDLGYTGWLQFDDGEIYVVSYIVDDAPKGQIRGYSFRMEDVILGQ